MNIGLTDISSIRILLEKREEAKMIGHIRVKGKCPKCGKKFEEIRPLGYLCRTCQTVPSRFYVDMFRKGKRIRIFNDKTGQVLDSYDRAERIRGHMQFEIDHGIFDSSKYVRAEASRYYAMILLDQFEKSKIEELAPSYQKDYRRTIRIVKEFFKNEDVREIAMHKVRIVEFKNYLINEFPNWSAKTLKNTMDVFKVFMHYLKDELGIIDRVPKFPAIDVPKPQIPRLQQADRIKLYEAVSDEDKPFFGFLMLLPCRPGEARAIKCKDVDLKSDIPLINIQATFSKNVYCDRRKGKGAKSYQIPIHDELLGYITERVRTSHPEAFLFFNPRTGGPYSQEAYLKVWVLARKKAGVPKAIKLYWATRHSIASQMDNENVPGHRISKALGHSAGSRSTENYVHTDLQTMKRDLSQLTLKRESVTRPSLRKKSDEKVI